MVNRGPRGTWTVCFTKYATLTDYGARRRDGRPAPADPRPIVRAGGPYRFEHRRGAGPRRDHHRRQPTRSRPPGISTTTASSRSPARPSRAIPQGRALATLKVTDDNGWSRRETASVLVADTARSPRTRRRSPSSASPTRASTRTTWSSPRRRTPTRTCWPDHNFTRHPSEYIAGYPRPPGAPDHARPGLLPGRRTRRSGADVEGQALLDPGHQDHRRDRRRRQPARNAAADATPILDDDGHGTGSASVSTGNRYGYCPTCLLSWSRASTSRSRRAPVGRHHLAQLRLRRRRAARPGRSARTRRPSARPSVARPSCSPPATASATPSTCPIARTAPIRPGRDWNITVGAIRRDNQRAIVGDGIPVAPRAWGDGNLPSACRTGTVAQCAFGGTSRGDAVHGRHLRHGADRGPRRHRRRGAGQRPGQVSPRARRSRAAPTSPTAS